MFAVELAGCRFVIQNRYGYIERQCRKYLSPETSGIPVSVTDEEIQREQPETGAFSLEYLESIAVCRKIADHLIGEGALLFHASAVAVDGGAYLFTGPSGYGKSTHARLWREFLKERAVMINDDKPFLRVTDGGVTVCGSPWDGKHHLSSNISVPLKAVCILERSGTNRVTRIPKEQALPMLVQSTHIPSDTALLKRTLELIEKLSRSADMYRIRCNMEPEAAMVAYNGIIERKD